MLTPLLAVMRSPVLSPASVQVPSPPVLAEDHLPASLSGQPVNLRFVAEVQVTHVFLCFRFLCTLIVVKLSNIQL